MPSSPLVRLFRLCPRAADVETSPNLYIEPGTTTVRSPDGSSSVNGKMVVDLNNGNIWGFPTFAGGPYPVDTTKSTLPVSHPIYMGKFDFAAIREGRKRPLNPAEPRQGGRQPVTKVTK